MIIGKKRNNKKILIITVSIILLFLIIIIIVKVSQYKKQKAFIEQEKQRVMQYTSINDFKTLEEVALYLNCKFIKQEKSELDGIDDNVYMELPFKFKEGNTNTRGITEDLIQYSAKVLNYSNFAIIDNKNDINILVYCNKDNKLIERYIINNIENYFDVQDNKKSLNSFETTENIELEATSTELQQIIKNNWKANNLNIGTKESTYRNYDIYFDEGIEVRKVNGKVYNIVFTVKYQDTIINSIKTTSTQDEIEKVLGKPQFEKDGLIGYKSEDLYVFFYDNQVSIYRNEEYDSTKFIEIVEKYKNSTDTKSFIKEIKDLWQDYDLYQYDKDFVKIRYALKGVYIKYDYTTKKGIIFYSNYIGKIINNKNLQELAKTDGSMPTGMYIENEDLVFLVEQERVNTLDDTTNNNNYATSAVLNTSSEFKTYNSKIDSDGNLYDIRFISINNKYPNSELKEVINKGMWLDNYNFVYSVEGKGIYIYNAEKREYKTVVTGNEKYNLNGFKDNKLYYDSNSIEINLQ